MWNDNNRRKPLERGYYHVFGPATYNGKASNQRYIANWDGRGWVEPITDFPWIQVHEIIVLMWFDMPKFNKADLQ